jgi:MFS superfamily sulfate permease-like transporter
MTSAVTSSGPAVGKVQRSADWLTHLPREVLAGIATAIVTLPICSASGLLTYQALGPESSAHGAAAGLIGATGGALFAVLASRSSFLVPTPRTSVALVQAGLVAALLAHQPFVNNLTLVLLAMATCLLLTGIWQIAFGLLGVGHIIKFAPHSVLAGFVNGIALLVAVGAFGILRRSVASDLGMLCVLVFAATITALMLYVPRIIKFLPAPIVGLVAGTVGFYALAALTPNLPLGPTVGSVAIDPTIILRATVASAGIYTELAGVAPQILLTSFVLAVVASLESLVAARVGRNLGAPALQPGRLLVAQGIGNAATAALGGIAICVSPTSTTANFKAGGRTRLSALISVAALFLAVVFMPWLVGAIPVAVLCAVLVATSILIFDRWSVTLLRAGFARSAKGIRASAWKNLAVIGVVMAVMIIVSVAAGVLAGIVLSCIIFIVDMARPLVRRRYPGDTLFSMRVRPERDNEILWSSGHLRVILELQGVMFFGNADDLCAEIQDRFSEVEMMLLDFQRVADIDVSAVGALQQAVSKARAKKKTLLFCAVPAAHRALFEGFIEPGDAVFGDRDAALEWMEEKVLREAGRSEFEEVPLDQVEFLRGLEPHEIELVSKYLMPMSFPAGTILCREGEEADYLWILSSGSVSLWLGSRDGQAGTRLGALARGTIVGEVSLLEGGKRYTTVRADENVTGYMIDREAFDSLLREHPQIGGRVLANIAREIAYRLRVISQAFGAERLTQ